MSCCYSDNYVSTIRAFWNVSEVLCKMWQVFMCFDLQGMVVYCCGHGCIRKGMDIYKAEKTNFTLTLKQLYH